MAKARQIKLSPPPSQTTAVEGGDLTSTWKNWFSMLFDILQRQGLVAYPPQGADGDESQYWHKIYDPAWAHMAITLGNAEVVANGGIVQDWTFNPAMDWQLVSDLAAGTITADNNAYQESGYYNLSITGYVEGAKNNAYVFTLYANGSPTQLTMPLLFGPNTETATLAWAGVVHVAGSLFDGNNQAVLDLRLTTGGPLIIQTMNWSMHRISPEERN